MQQAVTRPNSGHMASRQTIEPMNSISSLAISKKKSDFPDWQYVNIDSSLSPSFLCAYRWLSAKNRYPLTLSPMENLCFVLFEHILGMLYL